MKLGIVGTREFDDYKLMVDTIEENLNISKISTVVSGGASGADSLAAKFAKEYDIELEVYLPDWRKYGRSAGMIRNSDIVDASDGLIAFWNGISKGTNDSIKKARKQNKLITVVRYDN